MNPTKLKNFESANFLAKDITAILEYALSSSAVLNDENIRRRFGSYAISTTSWMSLYHSVSFVSVKESVIDRPAKLGGRRTGGSPMNLCVFAPCGPVDPFTLRTFIGEWLSSAPESSDHACSHYFPPSLHPPVNNRCRHFHPRHFQSLDRRNG